MEGRGKEGGIKRKRVDDESMREEGDKRTSAVPTRTFGLPSPLGIVVQPAATHLLTMVLNTREGAHIIKTTPMYVWSCYTGHWN